MLKWSIPQSCSQSYLLIDHPAETIFTNSPSPDACMPVNAGIWKAVSIGDRASQWLPVVRESDWEEAETSAAAAPLVVIVSAGCVAGALAKKKGTREYESQGCLLLATVLNQIMQTRQTVSRMSIIYQKVHKICRHCNVCVLVNNVGCHTAVAQIISSQHYSN